MAWLDHCNIRTLDLDATIRFYEDVIGLKAGPYPGPPGQGAWLYDEQGAPVVHVISLQGDRREQVVADIRDRLGDLTDADATSGSGAIDHVAFRCDDYDAMVRRIEAHGLTYRATDFPNFRLRQVFVNDPSGVTLELNFLEMA